MKEALESLVSAGKIERRHVAPLLALIEHGFCQHRGWGFGRIRQVDPVFGRMIIDFANKPGHSMDLGFAAEQLKPIPRDHILARKAEDLAGLRTLAALKHLEVIKLVLQSYGGRATLQQIQEALVPDVVTADWRKWWEAARQELKKDGHFLIPLKKTDPIVYQPEETSLRQRLLQDFRAAKGLKARLVAAAELLKNLGELDDPRAAAAEALALLNAEIASHQRTQPALALEAIFTRDDLRAAAGLEPAPDEVTARAVWEQVEQPGRVLEQITVPRQKRALQSFREARPADWHTALLETLNHVGARLCAECARALIEAGHLDPLKDHLARLISQHTASSELLLWLAKERDTDQFADLLGPEVFRAMLSAIERDQFQDKKTRRLQDYILSDQNLLVELIETADIEVIKDLTRALQLSPSFDDMDKRSLLARIVKHFPAVQSLIAGEQSRQEQPLVVSWESLERRRQEYRELVEKKIPANSRDIAIARSYGDLRENHEYKAAKEHHRLLMERKTELEYQLARARGTDFSDARADAVGIGTRVQITELGRDHTEVVTILGAWDFDTERHIVSYLSPLAQSLMGKKPGEEAELELEGHRARYRIDRIEPYRKPAEQPAAAAASEAAPAVAPPEAEPAPLPPEPASPEVPVAAPAPLAEVLVATADTSEPTSNAATPAPVTPSESAPEPVEAAPALTAGPASAEPEPARETAPAAPGPVAVAEHPPTASADAPPAGTETAPPATPTAPQN
jgi:transcription elongation GreA/GreB family factor